jgi:hypothetical protein
MSRPAGQRALRLLLPGTAELHDPYRPLVCGSECAEYVNAADCLSAGHALTCGSAAPGNAAGRPCSAHALTGHVRRCLRQVAGSGENRYLSQASSKP